LRAFAWLMKNESAFKQEFILLVVAVAVIAIWNISLYEKVMLLCGLLLVIFAEVINTAIEATIDRIGYEINPLSGLAKDLGSAAVFIAMLICLLVWAAVIFNNFP